MTDEPQLPILNEPPSQEFTGVEAALIAFRLALGLQCVGAPMRELRSVVVSSGRDRVATRTWFLWRLE